MRRQSALLPKVRVRGRREREPGSGHKTPTASFPLSSIARDEPASKKRDAACQLSAELFRVTLSLSFSLCFSAYHRNQRTALCVASPALDFFLFFAAGRVCVCGRWKTRKQRAVVALQAPLFANECPAHYFLRRNKSDLRASTRSALCLFPVVPS